MMKVLIVHLITIISWILYPQNLFANQASKESTQPIHLKESIMGKWSYAPIIKDAEQLKTHIEMRMDFIIEDHLFTQNTTCVYNNKVIVSSVSSPSTLDHHYILIDKREENRKAWFIDSDGNEIDCTAFTIEGVHSYSVRGNQLKITFEGDQEPTVFTRE